MSAFITAAVVTAGASIGASMIAADKQASAAKKAAEKARLQEIEDANQARKSEVFAETEGEGTGSIGEISLEVDDEIDEEEEALRQGSLQI